MKRRDYMKSNYMAYRCSNPEYGNNCACCQEILEPIGEAVIQERNNTNSKLTINVSVDTTELDKALAKAKELRHIINRL